MKPLKLAVLSDMHVGRDTCSADMCPYDDEEKVDLRLRESFEVFAREGKLSADYLLVPGDVTEVAEPTEAELASEIVEDVAACVGVKKPKIIFVPGNHDVDWDVLKRKQVHAVDWARRYDPIGQKHLAFYKAIRRGTGKLLDAPFLTVWEFDDLLTIGYNSSWHDLPTEEIHYGIIDEAHLKDLQGILADLDLSDDRIRSFVVHHHPYTYSRPVPLGVDLSDMKNGEALIDLLTSNHFDLLVHGHVHQPRFKTRAPDGAHPLAVLASGTFSFRIPDEWCRSINNQFHVIEVDGRCQETGVIQGRVRSWAHYFGHGWIPSTEFHDGILDTEPFGQHYSKNRLQELVESAMYELFKSARDVALDELSAVRGLKYVRPARLVEAVKAVADTNGWDVLRPNTPRLLVRKG